MKISEIEKAIVISLSAQNVRLQKFFHSIRPERIDVDLWLGVDGRKVIPPDWFQVPARLRAGSWGCWRAHESAIDHAIDHDIRSLLIFEDDAVCVSDFWNRFELALAELPESAECLYLGGEHLKERNGALEYISPELVRPYSVNRTHAYLLIGDGLKKYSERLKNRDGLPIHEVLDWRLEHLHESRNIDVYACRDWIVDQGAGVSVITNAYELNRSFKKEWMR